VKRLFGLDERPLETVGRRERRIYLAYGLLSSLSSFSLLGLVTVQLGDFLIKNNQPLLLVSASILLFTKLRRRLNRIFKGADIEDEDDGGSVKTAASSAPPAEPASARRAAPIPEPQTPGAAIPKPRSKSSRRRRRRRYGVLAFAGALAAGVVFIPMELRVSGPFTILPVHNADVRTEIEGIIEEIFVTEGDTLTVGDPFARLSDRELRNDLQKTESQIEQARARLRMQERGPTPEEIALARTTVQKAKDKLQYALSRLERNKILFEKDLLARLELENTEEQADIARNDLAEAEKKLNLIRRGARREELEASRAEIVSLETQKKYVQGQLERVDIRSPAAGTVTTPSRQLRELRGQLVQKGALIGKVFDIQTLTVEIAIPEKESADVKVGQSVGFKVRAYPDQTFYGMITSIATTAQAGSSSTGSSSILPSTSSGEKSLLVTTQVDNSSQLLKPGMTGQAKAYCGERRIIDLIMRRLARTIQVEFWSWW